VGAEATAEKFFTFFNMHIHNSNRPVNEDMIIDFANIILQKHFLSIFYSCYYIVSRPNLTFCGLEQKKDKAEEMKGGQIQKRCCDK